MTGIVLNTIVDSTKEIIEKVIEKLGNDYVAIDEGEMLSEVIDRVVANKIEKVL